MSGGADEVARWRADVDAAHALVARGAYREAAARFSAALTALTTLLGADHPEVEELACDLEACRSMGDLQAFGRSMGFRWQDHGPDVPSDGDGEP